MLRIDGLGTWLVARRSWAGSDKKKDAAPKRASF